MQIEKSQVNDAFEIQALDQNQFTLVEISSKQSMHSIIGPEAECNTVYVEPTWSWLQKRRSEGFFPRQLCIWDVGMGTASNVIYLLERLAKGGDEIFSLTIESFELHPEGLKKALDHPSQFPFLSRWKNELTELLSTGKVSFSLPLKGDGKISIHWKLHTGDFLQQVQEQDSTILAPPNLVYFDFYSPGKNPELWSESVFSAIRRALPPTPPSLLLTYSASTKIRVHLLEAGFFIGKGPKTGAKDEGTQASLQFTELAHPLADGFRKKILTSAVLEEDQRKRLLTHPQFASI